MIEHGQELLANFAIVVLFVSIWTNLSGFIEKWSSDHRAVAMGLLMGVGTLVVMYSSVEIAPGRFADLRFTLLSISGFFGGPLASVITFGIAGAARASVGGAGMWPGLIGIAVAAAIGLCGHWLIRHRMPKRSDLAWLSLATAIGVFPGFLAAGTIALTTTIPEIGAPVSIMVLVATTVVSFMIYQDNSRRQFTRANFTYRSIIQSLPDSLNAKDLDGRFIAANPATAALMHAENADSLIGRTDFEFYTPEVAARFRGDELEIMQSGESRLIDQEIVRSDGTKVWLSTQKTPLRDRSGKLIGLITHNRDITDHKRLEEELEQTQSRLTIALTYMADALVMFDPGGRLIFSNAQYDALFHEMSEVRAAGVNVRDILNASAERGEQTGIRPDKIEAWLATFQTGAHVDTDREIRLADGRWLHVRTRSTLDGGILAVLSDISPRKVAEQSLSELNARLEVLAMTDGLTGLMNRRAFDLALDDEFKRSARGGQLLSLLMIDVDRFKPFNDAYGHPAGDACLQAISTALMQLLRRPADRAARYGGEELAVILPDTSSEGAHHVAEAFRLAVRKLGIPHSGSAVGVVTISIGVATLAPGGELVRVQELILRADEALYDAKEAGRDRVRGWRMTKAREPLSEAEKTIDRRRVG